MNPEALKVEKLTVHYGKVSVLWELTFTIGKGTIVGIVGPNGAGKSTLLKALLKLVKTVSGEISFFGKSYKEMHKSIAYVPQRATVNWDFPITALDVVLMGLYGKLGALKWVTKKDKNKAREALGRLGMLGFESRQIGELSGGQQQRVFLARALVQEAQIYLLDEPFAGVDKATEVATLELMHALKREGKTLIMVHHDLSTVKSYFDAVLLLNNCLIAYGPVEEVFHEENIKRTYGTSSYLFNETKKLTQSKSTGLSS